MEAIFLHLVQKHKVVKQLQRKDVSFRRLQHFYSERSVTQATFTQETAVSVTNVSCLNVTKVTENMSVRRRVFEQQLERKAWNVCR